MLPVLPSKESKPDSRQPGCGQHCRAAAPSQGKTHSVASFHCLTFTMVGIKILEVAFSASLTRLKSILLSWVEK